MRISDLRISLRHRVTDHGRVIHLEAWGRIVGVDKDERKLVDQWTPKPRRERGRYGLPREAS